MLRRLTERSLHGYVVRATSRSSVFPNHHSFGSSAVHSTPRAPNNSYVLRSLFYVKRAKIAQPNCWYKAAPADAFILDLEDTVAEQFKPCVREQIRQICQNETNQSLPPQIFVRINGPNSSRDWKDDLELMHSKITGFILPKASAAVVQLCDEKLKLIEEQRGLTPGMCGLIPLIEDANGVLTATEIAKASQRNIALLIGRHDLQASLGSTEDSESLDQAYFRVLTAAKAANLQALFSVNTNFDEYSYVEKECKRMKDAGFDGRSTLTRAQVIIANRQFGYSNQEFKKHLETVNTVSDMGCCIDSHHHFIGPPHVRLSEKVIKRVEAQRAHVSTTQSKNDDDGLAKQKPQLIKGFRKRANHYEWTTSPYPVTITDGLLALWEQQFLPSRPHGQNMAPFSLLFNLSMSLSVVVFSYDAIVHLEIEDALQLEGVNVGQTVTNRVRVLSVTPKLIGDIVRSEHILVLDDGKTAFKCTKKTLFPPSIFKQSDQCLDKNEMLPETSEHFCDQAVADHGPSVNRGQLFVHDTVKSFATHDAVSLSYLLKGINPLHINANKFNSDELLLSGPCVVAATIANQGFDYGQIHSERLKNFVQINKAAGGDVISTLCYIQDLKPLDSAGNFEKVSLRVMGIKNVDPDQLALISIPLELFEENLRPNQYEELSESCPALYHRIVAAGTRIIIRAASGRRP